MARTIKTPAEINKAIVLREAGYSLASIASKTNISTATLARHFKKHGIGKGALSDSAINAAKEELISDGFTESLKKEITAAILDDLAHFKALREAIAVNLEELANDTDLPSHYRARGIAALCTSVGLSQTLIRKTLQLDDQEIEQGELPELVISELTAEDIKDLQAKQHQNSISTLEGDP